MEHKIRQEIFYRLNSNFDDDLSKFHIELVKDEKIVENAVKYFFDPNIGWVYPSKSYVVAICYAKWISKIWGYNFYDILNDESLLYGNDPYFLPYYKSKEIYDSIIETVGLDFNEDLGIINDVKRYFLDEFMISQEENIL